MTDRKTAADTRKIRMELLCTAALLLVLLFVPEAAFAEDGADVFSVSLPTTLPLEMDAEGNIITANRLTITNNASGPIAVSAMTISGVNGWTLGMYGTDYTRTPVDLKQFGLSIAGKEVPVDGNADLSGIPFVEGYEKYTVEYGATVAVQSRDLEQEIIGDMLITVSWKPGQLYSIEVTRDPNKTHYLSGETFNPEGMEVTAVYYGGERKVVTDYVVVDSGPLTTGTTGVRISYSPDGSAGASAVVPVQVSKRLTGISITSQPARTIYNHDEQFSAAGMLVRADYDDGSSGYIGSYTVTPELMTYGLNHVTVSYEESGISASKDIPVTVRRVPSGLKVTKAPDQTSYCHGDTFDPSGAQVTVTYTDGGTADVSQSVVWSRSVLEYTNQAVACSYTENGRTVTDGVTVTVCRVLDSLILSSGPDKTVYKEGAAFDRSGLVLLAGYTDGGTETVTDYACSPETLEAGTDHVTLSYTENGITKTVAVPVSVTVCRLLSGAEADAVLAETELFYTGAECRPAVTVTWKGTVLTEGTDYEVSYRSNTDPGEASAVVTGIGNYSGSRTLPFSIRAKLQVSWSGTEFICDNTVPVPTATVSGLLGTDTAEVTVTGAGTAAPGNYQASAAVSINSSFADYYRIENENCSYTIYPGQSVPTLRAGSLKAPFESAGLTANSIAAVEFCSCYNPTGAELEGYTLTLDADGTGAVKGYILPLGAYDSEVRYKLIVSGNGTGTIRANANSDKLFYSIVNRYDSDGKYGTIEGLNLLDLSGITSAKYMFANITADTLILQGLSFPNAKSMAFLFSGASINSLVLSQWECPVCTDMSYLFQRTTISVSADLSGLDTAHAQNMDNAFYSASMPQTLDLNAWNMSSVTRAMNLFENLKTTTKLCVSSWNLASLTSTESMFSGTCALKELNISTWDLSSVKAMNYMFYNTSIETLYIGNRMDACQDFTFLFSGRSCGISRIYSTGDWNLSSMSNLSQKCFTGNPNYENADMIAVASLKLVENGGILLYHEAFSD